MRSSLPIPQPQSVLDSAVERETLRRQCISFASDSDRQLAPAK